MAGEHEQVTIPDRYALWIEGCCFGRGQCAEATEAMVQRFPELRRVRGHVAIVESPKTPAHWWCETEDGVIVDPTARQFVGIVAYLPHEGEEPVGKCANCGGYIYASSGYTNTVCSDACASSYEAYCYGR